MAHPSFISSEESIYIPVNLEFSKFYRISGAAPNRLLRNSPSCSGTISKYIRPVQLKVVSIILI
jgi:hypothetical protein